MRAAATDPMGHQIAVLVGGRLLGCVTAFDEEEGWVEVMPVLPTHLRPRIGEWMFHRLKVPFELKPAEERPDRWIYWDGEGWLSGHSRWIQGPKAVVVDMYRKLA